MIYDQTCSMEWAPATRAHRLWDVNPTLSYNTENRKKSCRLDYNIEQLEPFVFILGWIIMSRKTKWIEKYQLLNVAAHLKRLGWLPRQPILSRYNLLGFSRIRKRVMGITHFLILHKLHQVVIVLEASGTPLQWTEGRIPEVPKNYDSLRDFNVWIIYWRNYKPHVAGLLKRNALGPHPTFGDPHSCFRIRIS